MSARRIDCAQVRTGGHTGPPLRWELPPRRAVHPKRSRPSFRNEKKLRFLLACELRKQRVTRIVLTQRTLRPRVTLCRDARSERPLYHRLQRCSFNGDGRPLTRHYPSVPTEIGVTAFDEWNCRVDVIRVGADLRVRPQNRLRSGEDGRTHRSAPYKELHVIKD